ncbi:MAG: TonB-dependent receptor [Bacteroidales bacterium]|nr:TonB-dependent receptor [Bacteroidales bacterium]
MKKIIAFIVFAFLCNFLYSQEKPNFQNIECEISGKVIDSQSQKPMPYANVTMIRMRDTTIAGGTITDDNGFFKIEKLRPGMYLIKIQFIGFERYTTNIRLTPQNPIINLGLIQLKPAVTQLTEVEVVGEKPLVEFQLDKKVINVDKNIVTSGGNAVDVLRNTPSVEVDMDGNVLLRGSTNVNILIDGKPSTLIAGDKSTILEQIPASTIERIEIITNPSAKYDPEGMAGILNIITKKEKRQGVNGLVSLNYGTLKKFGGTFSINRRINKTNLFFSYDYRNDDRKGYRNHDRFIYFNDSLISNTIIRSNREGRHMSHNFKAGIDYNINNYESITLSSTYRMGNRTGNDSSINKVFDAYNSYKQYYSRYEKSENPNQNIDISLNYRKRFSVPIREFTFDTYYSLGKFDDTENYNQINYFPIYLTPNQRSISNNQFQNITIQSDYVHPIAEKTRIDAGIKAMARTTDNNYNFFNFDTTLNDFTNDTLLSNHFIYSDYVFAAYTTFSHEWKKISIQIGLRAEETFQKGDQITSQIKFDNHYFNIFPSTHISYSLPNNNKLQTSYSRRINRPDPHSLNPFIDKSDPLTWHAGNPDLKPEYINSYEISHIKDWKKLSLTSDIFYKWTDNVVSRYRKVDTSGTVTVFPLNMNKAESYGLEFTLTSQPIKPLRLMATFSYYKTSVFGSNEGNDLTNSIFSYNARLNASLFLPKEWSLQLNGMFNGPSVMAQATRTAFYTVDAAIKKEIWNRKASVSIRMSDIFNTMNFQVKTDDPSMKAVMEFKRQTQILYVTFSYKINEGIKQRERQRQQEMNNMEMDFNE